MRSFITQKAKTKQASYVLSALLLLSGCTSTHFSNPPVVQPTLPGAGQATTSNGYTGTQNPGYWSLTLDDSQKVFSYQPVTYASSSSAPTQGTVAVQNNFLNLGTVSGKPAGMALELPSRLVTLRPGDNTTTPVSMVQESNCFSITGNVRFIFAGVISQQPQPNDGDTTYPAYGTLVASTSSDGKTWQFGDVHAYRLTDIGIPAGTSAGIEGPLDYTGSCDESNGQGRISVKSNPAFSIVPTFVFNPAGYFVRNSSPSTPPGGSDLQRSYAWLGMTMPASPLQPADITSASYRGFVNEPVRNITAVTQPVTLVPSTNPSGSLAGGTYPNDDPTQTPVSHYTITLGKQDATLNGVFPTATLVMPDPQRICPVVNQNWSLVVSPGFDVNGNPICTTKGVAVVGKPEDKYVIYFTALDGTADIFYGSEPPNAYSLQMYLFQQ
jgi:hypothetical protein